VVKLIIRMILIGRKLPIFGGGSVVNWNTTTFEQAETIVKLTIRMISIRRSFEIACSANGISRDTPTFEQTQSIVKLAIGMFVISRHLELSPRLILVRGNSEISRGSDIIDWHTPALI
jgi:hypothetical protein